MYKYPIQQRPYEMTSSSNLYRNVHVHHLPAFKKVLIQTIVVTAMQGKHKTVWQIRKEKEVRGKLSRGS